MDEDRRAAPGHDTRQTRLSSTSSAAPRPTKIVSESSADTRPDSAPGAVEHLRVQACAVAGSRHNRAMHASLRSAGDFGRESVTGGGSSVVFRSMTSRTDPSNGSAPGQGVVQRCADAVPVAGARRVQAEALLGRQIGGRAGDAQRAARSWSRRRRQAEVEHDDATGRGDQHVRRLDVAVQLASSMQFLYAVDQLRKTRGGRGRRRSVPATARARTRRTLSPRRAPS